MKEKKHTPKTFRDRFIKKMPVVLADYRKHKKKKQEQAAIKKILKQAEELDW